MLKESKTYTVNDKGEYVCFIRISDSDWSLVTQGIGKNKTEGFRKALIRLIELTTLNRRNLRHK